MSSSGFYGKTNLDALRIDEISWLWEDQLTSNLTGSRWAKDEKIKVRKGEGWKEWLEMGLWV